MSIDIIATRLRTATDFVQVAIEVCALAREHHGIDHCRVALQTADRRPVLVVEHVVESAPSGPRQTIAMPLLYPQGALGEVVFEHSRPLGPVARRDLVTLATSASVRLTELHVTPELDPRLSRLTGRQRDVARLGGKGLSNAEIGRALDLSHNTIKKHLKDIFETLDVSSRAQLAIVMCDIGPVHDYPIGITRIDGITIMRG